MCMEVCVYKNTYTQECGVCVSGECGDERECIEAVISLNFFNTYKRQQQHKFSLGNYTIIHVHRFVACLQFVCMKRLIEKT